MQDCWWTEWCHWARICLIYWIIFFLLQADVQKLLQWYATALHRHTDQYVVRTVLLITVHAGWIAPMSCWCIEDHVVIHGLLLHQGAHHHLAAAPINVNLYAARMAKLTGKLNRYEPRLHQDYLCHIWQSYIIIIVVKIVRYNSWEFIRICKLVMNFSTSYWYRYSYVLRTHVWYCSITNNIF